MNFVYGAGTTAYDKGVASRTKGDAAGARTLLETALTRDAFHFDAHYQLAKVLAAAGEHAPAVEHLVTALAGDFYRYAPMLADDKDLADFRATPHGASVTELATLIGADYAKRIGTGIFVLGRRSSFKWPKEAGAQYATSRGELYAFDRETRRYLRLSHTDHKVAGYVRSPSGKEVALLGFDKVDKSRNEDVPASFPAPWVLVLDTATWSPVGKKIALPAAREVSLGYADGALVATTAQADGRWATRAPQRYSLDAATGKASKSTGDLPVPRIALTLDEGRLVRDADGLQAVWSGEPPTTPSFKTAAGVSIAIPESRAAWQSSFAVAPVSRRVAFATAVDPCAKGVASSLYVGDGNSVGLRHLITAKSRFANRWLDGDTLAYEDGAGGIRLWDAKTQRQIDKLENKVGIALDVLSLAPARLCKGEAPPVAADDDAPDAPESGPTDDDLPPEEPGAPVTSPN